MSIDINWETVTSGPDGEALAESIRSFVHDKFQQVTLPGFIRSVQVHSFDFGKTCPELEIKDIGDPLPDFYEDEDDAHEGPDGDAAGEISVNRPHDPDQSHHRDDHPSHAHASNRGTEVNAASLHEASSRPRTLPPQINTTTFTTAVRSPFNLTDHQLGSPFPRSGTPGIPGGTSNLSYFHLPLGGLSGTQTPLAAVASGTNFPTAGGSGNWTEFAHHHQHPPYAVNSRHNHAENDSSSSARPSTAASLIISPPPIDNDSGGSGGGGAPPNVSPHLYSSTQIPDLLNSTSSPPNPNNTDNTTNPRSPQPPRSPSDLQIITHVKYAGDIRLTLTAEILLDYPMPSFVGIPLKLSITGLTFNGVAVLASIGARNVHFCFLAPEDAEMLVGKSAADEDEGADGEGIGGGEDGIEGAKGVGKMKGKEQWKGSTKGRNETGKLGGLLEEIRVESEIGRKDGGKQVLKNVGKVERFVLEQIRRIFEDEFVFPSFWTFLV